MWQLYPLPGSRRVSTQLSRSQRIINKSYLKVYTFHGLLHELQPQGPLAVIPMPGNHPKPLVAACTLGTLFVLASGTRYAAVDWSDAQSPKVLWQGDAEQEIYAHHYSMALDPTGKQVAFCLRKLKTVSVRDAATGHELRKLGPVDDIHGVNYSPDGSLLFVFGKELKVFDAETGEEKHSLRDSEDVCYFHAVVDPAGLPFVQELGPSMAGAASGAIYSWLGIRNDAQFPPAVSEAVTADCLA